MTLQNDSTLIRQIQCPICASEGRDRSKNNLAVYSDGHTYCFGGHGVLDGGSKIAQFTAASTIEIKHEILLPEDCDVEYPQRCLDWVGHYELTENDLLGNNVFWSESTQRLIFPVFGQEAELIAWQGRWFGEGERVKWFGKGNLKDTFNILGTGDKLVLVEDIVSAIKLSKTVSAMPLYGCHIGVERFSRLRKLLPKQSKVLIWLDPDKRKEAVRESRRGQLCGLDCSPIFSDKDPKEHSYDEIKEILNETTD